MVIKIIIPIGKIKLRWYREDLKKSGFNGWIIDSFHNDNIIIMCLIEF